MSRHKTFTGGTKITDFEPLTFELNSEQFECKPAIQGAVLLAFIRDAGGDNGGDSAGALYRFFKDCMSEDEYARFMSVLEDENTIIDLELIGEIAAWLVEEYSARPTRQPQPSSSGQSTSGRLSTVKESSTVSA